MPLRACSPQRTSFGATSFRQRTRRCPSRSGKGGSVQAAGGIGNVVVRPRGNAATSARPSQTLQQGTIALRLGLTLRKFSLRSVSPSEMAVVSRRHHRKRSGDEEPILRDRHLELPFATWWPPWYGHRLMRAPLAPMLL